MVNLISLLHLFLFTKALLYMTILYSSNILEMLERLRSDFPVLQKLFREWSIPFLLGLTYLNIITPH